MADKAKLAKLRLVITENLRVQRGGAERIPYIDVSNSLPDVLARQNHAIFARRGCGKTLLLHHSSTQLPSEVKTVYLNCEDFKHHSFPNVLIEILDAVFGELHRHMNGWFGRKKKSKDIIAGIREEFSKLRERADSVEQAVKEISSSESASDVSVSASLSGVMDFDARTSTKDKNALEKTYRRSDEKLRELNLLLPRLKQNVREFFEISSTVKAVFIQVDDLYHLRRTDQPFVMDYIHRLCKDVPLYFKVATLRHASALYADRNGQPTGAQERHDYQPINIDFTFSDFSRTEMQIRRILHEFGRLASMTHSEVDSVFKGDGFRRLVMAGGGVPRDCLSLFLEVLDRAQQAGADGRIGKDDVRILSRSNFEHRIEELKQDSEGPEQDTLLRGIYVIRRFCLDKKTNVFFVSEQMMQQEDRIRDLIYRLLDYRIIHSAGSAITHKSQAGSYQAFVIDVGCYAHMRTLEDRFTEIDVADTDVREKMRSAPILTFADFNGLWQSSPEHPADAMLAEGQDAA